MLQAKQAKIIVHTQTQWHIKHTAKAHATYSIVNHIA